MGDVNGDIPPFGSRSETLRELGRAIQRRATVGSPLPAFLREAGDLLFEALGCSEIELVVRNGAHWTACRLPDWRYDVLPALSDGDPTPPWDELEGKGYRMSGAAAQEPVLERSLTVGGETVGHIGVLESKNHLPRGSFDWIADRLAGVIATQRSQAALRERVKELTCLYELGQLTQRPDLDLEEVMERVAAMLPPAWQYPEITVGRVNMDGREWWSPERRPTVAWQRAEIVIRGQERGAVEVGYTEECPELDEGPFLAEERKLIEAISMQVAVFAERREAEIERSTLAEQLRHADRLATIGQLAAGVAHELNEPLGNILGLGELALATENLPEALGRDLHKIVDATLFAREIIRKLMLFSRQAPPRTGFVSVNSIVRDGLFFLQARCQRAGITVERQLEENLPQIIADAGQIHQVLVNLVVNAIQAMPEGGRLLLETLTEDGDIVMAVEDTGVGMTRDVVSQIFYPFFTTKDVDEGTGLGLAVVHGIVTAHGGRVDVRTAPGEGTRFEVRLPVAGPEAARGDEDG